MADITVHAGGNLQQALTIAAGGDRILLEAGATFAGVFTFPSKSSEVTVTSTRHAELPDRQLTPADAGLLPTLVSTAGQKVVDIGANSNWTLDGLNFLPNPGGFGEVISIEGGNQITLRRLVLVVPDTGSQRRFIFGNGTHITLRQSYCSGVWSNIGQDSQAFAAWDGAGPYTIEDNYLEAASENVMFGGADASSDANLPADILVQRNTFSKPLRWKGLARGVKNLFELKAARRVVVRNNVFEHCWVDAQTGYGIVLTPRNQGGTANFTEVRDVLFERNIIRGVVHGFNILGYDNLGVSQQTTDLVIRHNLVLTDGGRFALLQNEIGTLVFDHNTYVNARTHALLSMIELGVEGTITIVGGSRVPQFAVANLTVQNALMESNAYGVRSSAGFGKAVLDALCPSYTWRRMVLVGTPAGVYPADTTLISETELHQHLGSDYRLVSGSVFQGAATDGGDIGWEGQTAQSPSEPPPDPDPDPFPDPGVPPQVDPTVLAVSLSPSSVEGGKLLTLTVTLDKVAPTGGWPYLVESAELLGVTTADRVAEGFMTDTFTLLTPVVQVSTPVSVRVSADGGVSWKTASATLTPVPVTPPPAPTLDSLTITPASLTGGASATGVVTLTGPAQTLQTVFLSEDAVAVVVPSTVQIPVGQSSASFLITTTAVPADVLGVSVQAMLGVVTRQALLDVLAVAPPPVVTPDPTPDPTPPPATPLGTVTITRRGNSNTFRVKMVAEDPSVVSRVEFLVNGEVQVTQTAPTAGTTWQTNLVGVGVSDVVEVKIYGR